MGAGLVIGHSTRPGQEKADPGAPLGEAGELNTRVPAVVAQPQGRAWYDVSHRLTLRCLHLNERIGVLVSDPPS